jgi:hypothetical protein
MMPIASRQHVTGAHEGAHGLVQVEIGSADVGTGDLDDRVARLFDHWVGDLFYRFLQRVCNVALGMEGHNGVCLIGSCLHRATS